jgi:hypothetical protein
VTHGELSALWREQADNYERDGARAQAAVLRRVADELDAAEGPRERLVGYAEAALLSGYSASQLRRLVRAGRLRDQADHGPTQLAVSELPRKAPRPERPLPLTLRRS